ncbi:MAG TPA: hypothetical protein ENN46_00720 [Candidatus Woesearchaeota archaeon]|nr:hypothetical protein [Candidatus Woesearchaeota archaeon]
MVNNLENMDSEEKIRILEELRKEREEDIKNIEKSIKKAEREKESEESLKRRITESSQKNEEEDLSEIIEGVSKEKQEEEEADPARFYQQISSRTQELYQEARQLVNNERSFGYEARRDFYSIEREAEAIRQYGIKNEEVDESLSALDQLIKNIRKNIL